MLKMLAHNLSVPAAVNQTQTKNPSLELEQLIEMQALGA